ncbi:MAG: hypothetical protein IKT89_04580 [Clostridia bacterium]|nr:hypothetical protein [Clostridia bacterium]
MEKKMTKKEWFAQLKGIVENSQYADKDGALEFIAHEVALLEKKSGSKSMTKTQKENEVLIEQIYDAMVGLDKAMTVTELMTVEGLDFSNQKLSALLKKLVEGGRVAKTVEGKKSLFKAIVEVDLEDEDEVEGE